MKITGLLRGPTKYPGIRAFSSAPMRRRTRLRAGLRFTKGAEDKRIWRPLV